MEQTDTYPYIPTCVPTVPTGSYAKNARLSWNIHVAELSIRLPHGNSLKFYRVNHVARNIMHHSVNFLISFQAVHSNVLRTT